MEVVCKTRLEDEKSSRSTWRFTFPDCGDNVGFGMEWRII